MKKNPVQHSPSTVFKVGAVSLAFLTIGYQAALFIGRASVMRIESLRDCPDTVYVVDEALARRLLTDEGQLSQPRDTATARDGIPRQLEFRAESAHSRRVAAVREASRRVESFEFDPNTAGLEEFRRLGFSEKQAQAILNYRQAGGRFNRKEDFAKSFVVSDSVYSRLAAYISIPVLDINAADSAAFDALPGIGPYFASRMVSYRERLGGYSCCEQLMEIYRFDRERFDTLRDLICCHGPSEPFRLWSLPAEELARHPHIGNIRTARSVVLYRENVPDSCLTVAGLEAAGVLPHEAAQKLSLCVIAPP